MPVGFTGISEGEPTGQQAIKNSMELTCNVDDVENGRQCMCTAGLASGEA